MPVVHDAHKTEYLRQELRNKQAEVQKKTFTKWMNSFLQKAKIKVEDPFVDLADGKILLKLLEIISGEKLAKPNDCRMRVHKIENVNKALAFLHTKIKLESIGAEDIVDGNKTLILGLLWTIILRFQIQDIQIQLEDVDANKKHSAKEALLLWCQRKTKGYPHVKITDFTQSWRNGMAFNALIHSHRPELIDYTALDPNDNVDNLNNAFQVARKSLAIEPLLDAEDVDTSRPDEKSIMTYVSSYYHTFAKYNSEVISSKRIANIIAQLMEIDRLQLNYELYTTNLLNWIQMKIHQLNDRRFPNNLQQIQNELAKFKEYRTVEKPPKYIERSEIEALLFSIQTKRKAFHQPPYVPSEGKLVQDIHKNWVDLEKAEHKRELALREEMIRVERINKIMESFFRKSRIRKNYLEDVTHVLSDPIYGTNLDQVEATVKKHEAISADILSRSERIESLGRMVQELKQANCHNIQDVEATYQHIKTLLDRLLVLLEMHRQNLLLAANFIRTKLEIETLTVELNEMSKRMMIDQTVPHLTAVQEYMQRHRLQEAQITSHTEPVKRLTNNANKLLTNEAVKKSPLLQAEIPKLKQSLNALQKAQQVLSDRATKKRQKLDHLQEFYRLLQDISEEEAELAGKLKICQTILPGKDLVGIISLQQKHNVFESEVNAHEGRIRILEEKCEKFRSEDAKELNAIARKLEDLRATWQQLQTTTRDKSKELSVIIEAFQHHADTNETESWLREKTQLARSEDYGTDEQSAQSLLKRHASLENEVAAYKQEIERLNEQSQKMINSDVESLFLLSQHNQPYLTDAINIDAPDVSRHQQEIMEDVYEDVSIAQVYVLYNFKGQGYSVKKDQVLVLVEKSTPEWWKVCYEDNVHKKFYVPATYVKEIEPKITRIVTKRPVKSRQHLAPMARRPSNRRLSIVSSAEKTVEQRKNEINVNYGNLLELCQARRKLLEDSVKVFKFNGECDTFETWLNEYQANIQQCLKEQKNQSSISDEDRLKEYEKLITDLLASRSRMEEINKMYQDIQDSDAYLPAAKKRIEQIKKKWEQANFLQKQLGKNIKGLTTVKSFEDSCNQILERINDKLEKIADDSNVGQDLKTVQALQRQHENLERELKPIDESLNKLTMISENVKSSYPLEKAMVDRRLDELKRQWERLQKCCDEKRNALDRMSGLQIIQNSSQDIIAWLASYVKPMLQYDMKNQSFKDPESLQTITKEHNDLLTDIKGKRNDIEDLEKLAKKLANQVDPKQLKIVNEMIGIYNQVHQEWQDKSEFLKQCKDVNNFNQEADRIDTLINSDLTFLEYADTGNSIHDVHSLIKRHETFLNTLNAQDQRVHNLIDLGEKLIQNKHFDSDLIKNRQNKILQRRKMLKEKAYNRAKVLNDARQYQEIKNDADDFLNWTQLKSKLIKELLEDRESLKNGAILERKMKKHKTLKAEVRANQQQIDQILNSVDDLNRNSHFVSKEQLEQISRNVKNEWINLNNLIDQYDRELHELQRQTNHKKALKSINDRVNEIKNLADSKDRIVDRRNCKKQMKENKLLEQELQSLEDKLADVVNKRQEANGDAKEVFEEDFEALKTNLVSLKEPLQRKRQFLQQLEEYYQLELDIDAELQWIRERVMLVASNDVPQNLTDAQNWIKKIEHNLKREVEAHEAQIDRTIQKANKLVQEEHPSSKEIQAKSKELDSEWQNLLRLLNGRIEKLRTYLKVHQFLSDCNEIETWMNDKINIINSPIYAKDESALIKLLQKQKSLDLEIDTYSGLIEELIRQAEKLSPLMENEAEKKGLMNRAQDLNSRLKKIQKLSYERNLKLMEMKNFHEYYRDCNEFLNWVAKQKQTLNNNDYGKDYEHCTILQKKFLDLKRLVLANEEWYRRCIENGKRFQRREENRNLFVANTEDIKTVWEELLTLVEKKENKFIAAIKIHRFNRDVADALERIREKSAILNNQDYGRDTHSTQNLIRNHDIFENDLLALEAKLQILINDSVKLKATSSVGENAKQITEKLNTVVEHWGKLKNGTMARRQTLEDAYEYHQLMSTVRKFEKWVENLTNEMKINDDLGDNPSFDKIQNAKSLYERILSEIDSRKEEFEELVKEANAAITNQFYPEIKLQIEQLLGKRKQLHEQCKDKNELLVQLLDYTFFDRDVKKLESVCHQYKNRLNSMEHGTTVVLGKNDKKFEEFIKLFHEHDPKFVSVNECGKKLIQKQNRFSDVIKKQLEDLNNQKDKLSKLISLREEQLKDDLMWSRFKQDVLEIDSWINEKRAHIERERMLPNDKESEEDMEIQLKKLQKLQALESEVKAHVPQIDEIKVKAKELIGKNHPSSVEIRAQQDRLLAKWDELQKLMRNMSQGFEEAKDIYEFNKTVQVIEAWIRQKEMMSQFNDTGEDYEHCDSLLGKLDDVGTGMKVDEDKIKHVNNLANKLVSPGNQENFYQVEEKRTSLNEKWQKLQQKIVDYRNRLSQARDLHGLSREFDNVNESINEKLTKVLKECDAKDLASAENAQRRHEKLCFEFMAIEKNFQTANENYGRKMSAAKHHPELNEKIQIKIQTIHDNLRRLYQECGSKGQKLKILINMHRFFEQTKEYETWANNMLASKLQKKSAADNVQKAKTEIQEHDYLKSELNTKRDLQQQLKDHGMQLIRELEQNGKEQNRAHIEKIEECLQKSEDLRKRLDQAWEDRHVYLKQCLQLHTFNDLHKQCDLWLSSKEAFLTNEDLGTNLATVEELLKKHDTFVQSLAAQQRITEFSKFAKELVDMNHFDSQNIQIKLNEILERRDKLFELAKVRKNKLEDSKQYFNFLRNFNEIQRWLIEKINVANDESYRESINLLSKKQKHAAFEAEINSNKERIDKLVNESESLIKSGHFRADDIAAHQATIERLRQALKDSCELKRNRLNEAYQASQFFRQCDNLLAWIKDPIEKSLADPNFGKDLGSVRNLLKKHQLLKNDIRQHKEKIEIIKDQLAQFEQAGHFQLEEIQEKGRQVIKSFNDIQAPCDRRQEILEEHLTFYQYKSDVEHEFLWIREKNRQLSQFDNANTVFDIERHIKRLRMLDQEIHTRASQFNMLVSKGHSLLKTENANYEVIKQLTNDLQHEIEFIKDAYKLKRIHLDNALESHQFYADVHEAESWIDEKMLFLSSNEKGHDEESVAMLLKKVDAITKEVDRFQATMDKLRNKSDQLVAKKHSDSDQIEEKAKMLNKKLDNLNRALESKQQILLERKKYFLFEREADELISWIQEQLTVANSDDYGVDFEDAESLIHDFETFILNMSSNEERIRAIEQEAKNVPGSEEKMNEIRKKWNEIEESINWRREKLQDARQVHRFYRSCDETISWINEKESSTVLAKADSDDIDTVKIKILELDGFERDLNALKEQVEILFVEADRLMELVPEADIQERKQEVKDSWELLNAKVKLHKEDLNHIENIQSYLDMYDELLTWINEMQALITADDKLMIDVTAAEQQLNRHREYESDIKAKSDQINNFLETGEKIIAQKQIISQDRATERNQRIKQLYENLFQTWLKRLRLYEYNLDARQFLHEVDQVEQWLKSHHDYVDDNNYGDSITEVEELLVKHEEFEKMVNAQMEKRNGIERYTLIEKYFDDLKREEENQRNAERIRREKEKRMEEEQKKILFQRRNEEQRNMDSLALNKEKPKAPRRVTSFSFQRKSPRLEKPKTPPPPAELPPISYEGFLQRKNLLTQGGKRSTSRSWKTYYTLLSGQLLCFFKDKESFYKNTAAAAPFSILNAHCTADLDYKKKKHTFTIQLTDNSKYLFATTDDQKLREWIEAITFRANLEPSQQLLGTQFAHSPTNPHYSQESLNTKTENDSPGSSSSSRKSSLTLPVTAAESRTQNGHHSDQQPLYQNVNDMHVRNGQSSSTSVNDVVLRHQSPEVPPRPSVSPVNQKSKYASLPPNVAPINEHYPSSSAIYGPPGSSVAENKSHSFDADNTSLNNDAKKSPKRRSFLQRIKNRP